MLINFDYPKYRLLSEELFMLQSFGYYLESINEFSEGNLYTFNLPSFVNVCKELNQFQIHIKVLSEFKVDLSFANGSYGIEKIYLLNDWDLSEMKRSDIILYLCNNKIKFNKYITGRYIEFSFFENNFVRIDYFQYFNYFIKNLSISHIELLKITKTYFKNRWVKVDSDNIMEIYEEIKYFFSYKGSIIKDDYLENVLPETTCRLIETYQTHLVSAPICNYEIEKIPKVDDFLKNYNPFVHFNFIYCPIFCNEREKNKSNFAKKPSIVSLELNPDLLVKWWNKEKYLVFYLEGANIEEVTFLKISKILNQVNLKLKKEIKFDSLFCNKKLFVAFTSNINDNFNDFEEISYIDIHPNFFINLKSENPFLSVYQGKFDNSILYNITWE